MDEAKDWDQVKIVEFAEKIDPKFARSIFVFTKFHFQLLNFSQVKDLTTFLGGRPSGKVKSFFISLFSPSTHSKVASDSKQFKEKVEQSFQRDLELLAKLKYDHK